MSSTIAVGVDGLEPSLIALRWAVAEAALRGASLVAVIARPSALDWPHDSPRHVDEVNRHISDRIDQIRGGIEGALSHSTGPAGVGSSAVEIQVIEGHPNEVLVGVSKRVDLLVVGGHGYSGWKGAVSGSLTGQLAGHTVTPLAVVRQIPERGRGRILVGVDGLSSAEAIRFGLSEAALRGASVTAVSTWQYPVLGTRPTSPEAAELLEEGARGLLEEAISACGEHPEIRLARVVQMGHPVEVLVERAGSADLVVVGSRGRGGFAALLLGSVALGVLHRVAGPVVIVPRDR